MSLNETAEEIAITLRDVILATPYDGDGGDSEDAYQDLGARFVLALAKKGLTIAPHAKVDHKIELAHGAARSLGILTEWLRAHPACRLTTRLGIGKIEAMARQDRPGPAGVDNEIRGFFTGESIQDAYGQMAQTIVFNGGDL